MLAPDRKMEMTTPEVAVARPLPLESILSGAVAFVFGFGISGWLLALAGLFRIGPLVILGAAATYTIWTLQPEGDGESGRSRGIDTAAVLLVAATIVAGAAFGGEGVLADGPGPANALTARHLASGDGIVIPLGAEAMPPPGFTAVAGGVVTTEPAVFAALLGTAALVGDAVIGFVTPVLGGLAVLALYLLGATMLPAGAALLATAAFAAGPLPLFAGRATTSTLFAAFLILAGIRGLERSAGSDRLGAAAVAGALLGTGAAVTGEFSVYAGALFVVLALGIVNRGTSWTRRRAVMRTATAVAAGYGVMLVPAVWDVVRRGTGGEWFGAGWYVVPAALAAGLAVLRVRGRRPSRRWQTVAGAVIALAAAAGLAVGLLERPVDAAVLAPGSVDSWSVRWLWWYAGPIALILGGVSLGLLPPGGDERGAESRRALLVIGVVSGTVLILRPGPATLQPAAAMGFVPLVLPALLIAAARILAILYARPDKYVRQTAAVLLGAGLIAGAGFYAIPVWDAPVQSGARPGIETVCAAVPTDNEIAVTGEPAAVMVPALVVFCDRPVRQIAPGESVGAGTSIVTVGFEDDSAFPVGTLAVERLLTPSDAPPDGVTREEYVLAIRGRP